jgi:hypothetical protein
MEAKLRNLLSIEPLVSSNNQMSFFNLGEYNSKLAEKYGGELESRRQMLLHPLTTEWTGGFSGLETSAENNWHWCSSQGELLIDNTSGKERKIKLEMGLATGYEEFANLSLDGPSFSEKLKINMNPTAYSRTITLPPGRHVIRFACDAKPVHAPWDNRSLVFRVLNFSLQAVK